MMELNQKNKKNIFLQKRNGLNIFVMIEEIKTDHILQSRGKINIKEQVIAYCLRHMLPKFLLYIGPAKIKKCFVILIGIEEKSIF